MERKFTDDEIVKALEICSQNIVIRHNGLTYEGIPLRFLFEDALDLINRQKAEIQRLNFENLQMIASIKHLKSEAIKEFAERLKANMSNIARMEYGGYTYFCVGYGLIDNLVKEMTGEDHNGKPKQDS